MTTSKPEMFYTINDLSFVRNPYLVAHTDLINIFNGDDNNQDEFIAIKYD